jgi:hypothetical protein
MDIVDPRVNPAWVPKGSQAVIIAKDQPEYRPLPSVCTPDGRVITRWQPSDEERALIAAGEDLYLTILTFNQPMQPILLTAGPVNWAVGQASQAEI